MIVLIIANIFGLLPVRRATITKVGKRAMRLRNFVLLMLIICFFGIVIVFYIWPKFSRYAIVDVTPDKINEIPALPSTAVQQKKSELSSLHTYNEKKSDIPSSKPIIKSITLAAVGDIIVYRSMMRDARTEDGYDFSYMFADVASYLEEADVLFANQESMIGGESIGLSDYPRFNSPFAIADALKALGVTIVSVANNHTLDKGYQAVQNGLGYWNKLGILYTGAYLSETDANEIRVVESNDISIAFLAYTYGTNGLPSPADKPWIVNRLDEDKVINDIAQASSLADVVVVSYHFGTEYERLPNESQKKWAKLAADNGAHIVLGHHPHVLQPLEWIEQANGERTLVAYSLGNFLAAQEGIYRDLGGILTVRIDKTTLGEASTVSVQTPAFVPTWIHKKNWSDYRIIPLHQVSEDLLPKARQYELEIITHLRTWMPELVFPEHD